MEDRFHQSAVESLVNLPTVKPLEAIRTAFLEQANACRSLESPFMVRLCELISTRLEGGDAVSDRLLQWPDDRTALRMLVALRIAGALHALVLEHRCAALEAVYPPHQASDSALWRGVSAAFREHPDFFIDRLAQAPQTNEVRRAAIVTPGFLEIAARTGYPLMLSEIGASAGINLHWDQFGYRLGDVRWGSEQSSIQLAPAWQGPSPPMVSMRVIDRAGCDLHPVDPSSETDCLRMLSYIWADQSERIQRTRAALALAASARDVRVEAADVLEWLPDRLASQPPGTVHIIYHTIVWQYFTAATQTAAQELIKQAGARATPDRKLAWLAFEADANPHGAALRLRLWPDDTDQVIARADFHGRWVQWEGLHGSQPGTQP